MTGEELREKMARLLCTLRGQDPDSVFYRVRIEGGHETIRRWMNYTREADAAIALVLEEAAKVEVPGFDIIVHVDGSYSSGWKTGVEASKAAIRALKGD